MSPDWGRVTKGVKSKKAGNDGILGAGGIVFGKNMLIPQKIFAKSSGLIIKEKISRLNEKNSLSVLTFSAK
ncbi:MAG: hypothetical protein ABSE74_02585 [Methanoregula sp.]|jgi:hypothetical protein